MALCDSFQGTFQGSLRGLQMSRQGRLGRSRVIVVVVVGRRSRDEKVVWVGRRHTGDSIRGQLGQNGMSTGPGHFQIIVIVTQTNRMAVQQEQFRIVVLVIVVRVVVILDCPCCGTAHELLHQIVATKYPHSHM